MSFLMTSLVWPLKGFSIQWTEQAQEDQPTMRTTPGGPWRPLPLLWKTPPSCTILTGQKGPAMLSPGGAGLRHPCHSDPTRRPGPYHLPG